MNIEDVIIVGAGPAGVAAGIQFKRYGINPIILEKDEIGGLLRNAGKVENYPGFPGGVSGSELIALFKSQLANFSIDPIYEKVTNLDYDGRLFRLTTTKQNYRSRTMLVASGTKHREFSDIVIPEDARERIFYEIHPIMNTIGKKMVIVGAGDAAYDYALSLGNSNDIVILNRGEDINCLTLLKERASNLPGIGYYNNTDIISMTIDPSGRLNIECDCVDGIRSLTVDYLLFAIGREPQLDFLSKELSEKAGQLEEKGILYFAGDVSNGIFRQAVIAAGDGLKAAMKIWGYLKDDRG